VADKRVNRPLGMTSLVCILLARGSRRIPSRSLDGDKLTILTGSAPGWENRMLNPPYKGPPSLFVPCPNRNPPPDPLKKKGPNRNLLGRGFLSLREALDGVGGKKQKEIKNGAFRRNIFLGCI